MGAVSSSQGKRVSVLRELLRSICRSFALYYDASFRISESPSHFSDDYWLWLHCPHDLARSAVFLMLEHVVNEKVELDGDIIKIVIPVDHPCLNGFFDSFMSINAGFEWRPE